VFGKIFVEDELKVSSGTAFFVSPTILCTAAHIGNATGTKRFTMVRGAITPAYAPGQLYDVEEVGAGMSNESSKLL